MQGNHNRLSKIDALAKWLDNQYKVPFTPFRVGIDGLIGMIPVIGDTLAAVLSGWIIYQAIRLKVPFGIILLMLWNVFVDWLIGLIPVFGDVFDIGWQANLKNVNLIKEYMNLQNE